MYQSLSLRGGFFWLAAGHQVNYGEASQYMAFDSFSGNAAEKLIKANPQIWVDSNIQELGVTSYNKLG